MIQLKLQGKPDTKRRRLDDTMTNFVCVSREDNKVENQEWNAENCNLKEVEQSDGTKQSICMCKKPAPTTIMDDVG